MEIEILGYIGAITASIFLLPQLVQVIKTKKTKELSIWFTILGTINGIIWATYGGLTNAIPVLITNIIILSFSLIMLVYKIYNIVKHNDEFKWPWQKEKQDVQDK